MYIEMYKKNSYTMNKVKNAEECIFLRINLEVCTIKITYFNLRSSFYCK